MASPDVKLSDLTAEELVIGSVLLEGWRIAEVRGVVSADDFTSGKFARYYRAMLALHDRGVPIDIYTFLWEVEAMGGERLPSDVASAVVLPVTAAHARWYAARVHELAERRRAFQDAQRMAEAALRGGKALQRRRGLGGVEL